MSRLYRNSLHRRPAYWRSNDSAGNQEVSDMGPRTWGGLDVSIVSMERDFRPEVLDYTWGEWNSPLARVRIVGRVRL